MILHIHTSTSLIRPITWLLQCRGTDISFGYGNKRCAENADTKDFYRQFLFPETRHRTLLISERYWDWMIDPENTTLSSIWDPIHGFGGNGSASDGCVAGGPLQGILLNYTWDGYDPHCLTRNLTDTAAFYGGESDAVKDIVNTAKTYDEFRERLERGPHKHIHLGINGEMLTSFSSNGKMKYTGSAEKPS